MPSVAQLVKNLSAIQETWVQSLGWKDPLETIPCIVHEVEKIQTPLNDFLVSRSGDIKNLDQNN